LNSRKNTGTTIAQKSVVTRKTCWFYLPHKDVFLYASSSLFLPVLFAGKFNKKQHFKTQ